MTATRAIIIRCDQPGCPAVYRADGVSLYHARSWAMLERWSCRLKGDFDYCPEHRTTRLRGTAKGPGRTHTETGQYAKATT